jgi:hypothetical protein
MTNKAINELCETFIYLADQHGIYIQATSITEESFRFEPKILRWNEDIDLITKCNDLAISIGLSCDDNKCYIDNKTKLFITQDKKIE